MKNSATILIVIILLFGCSGNDPLNYKDIQKRRDNLFYIINTEDLANGIVTQIEKKRNDYTGEQWTETNIFEIEDGKLNGEYILLNETQKIIKCNYKDGLLTGNFQMYSENGDLIIEGQLKDGERIGDWRSYGENGKFLTLSFSSNNDFTIKGPFKNGKVDITFKDGKISEGFSEAGVSLKGDSEHDYFNNIFYHDTRKNLRYIYNAGRTDFNNLYDKNLKPWG